MKRCIRVAATALVFVFTGISSAFAGQWVQDPGKAALSEGASNWYWQEDDGSRAKNCRLWLDGNQDRIYEMYSFDEDGWMLANTMTEYGGMINADGALMDDAVTVSQMIAPQDSTVITTPDYTLTLPDNWKNHFCYSVRAGILSVNFFPMQRDKWEGRLGDTVAETMFLLVSYDSAEQRALEKAVGIYDSWRDWGTHEGTYYVSFGPTDTAMGYYTEEERAQIRQMRKSLWEDAGISPWERLTFHKPNMTI